ncbi:IS66 family transposase zinc-finger binding domain-containing protein [Ligilactobacillus ruminis]
MKCRTDEELENSKIREEVKFVPARLKLIEYHQAVYKCPIITGKSQKIRS